MERKKNSFDTSDQTDESKNPKLILERRQSSMQFQNKEPSQTDKTESDEHGIERFEFLKYSHIFAAGAVGGALFICYPVIQGSSESYQGLVGTTNSRFLLPMFMISFGGLLGGFLALISKQNRLWPAFVMGLSFNSVLTSVLPESVDTTASKPDVILQESSDTLRLPEQTHLIRDLFETTAYANDCGTLSGFYQRAKAFYFWEGCDIQQKLGFLVSQTAESKHRDFLVKAFQNHPEKSILFRTTGEFPKDMKLQVIYGDQVTNYRLSEGLTVIPYLGEVTKVIIYGDPRLKKSEYSVGPDTERITVDLDLNLKKASISAIKGGDERNIITVDNWEIGLRPQKP
ncbi:MAG: hypothetical protein HRU19_15670 [Pseudobacteriovorax sp.]|nr:hypothetical protein [Pseudobacteriovorax sp.]